jgi:hypothetical protein
MNVKELNEQQIEELKIRTLFDFKNSDDLSNEELKKYLTQEEYKTLENAKYWNDIPNNTIYKMYDDIYFVKEDFGCNNEEEI